MSNRKLIPMLFSTDMARANVELRKSETRRTRGLYAFNQVPDKWVNGKEYLDKKGRLIFPMFHRSSDGNGVPVVCPYGKPGDVMWMRETFFAYGYWFRENINCPFEFRDITLDQVLGVGKYEYMDSKPFVVHKSRNAGAIGYHKKPNMHMPLEACRFFAEIVDIRLERLHDITDNDAACEGVRSQFSQQTGFSWINYLVKDLSEKTARDSYITLWRPLNGYLSWHANPWVWVVKYAVLPRELYADLLNRKLDK